MPATLGILALAATLTATPIAHKPETVQVRMRDGSRVEVPAPPSSRAARPRIVEFRQAPGVIKGTLFDRFRRDLGGAVAASATENGRPRAAVPTREFHRTFRGVAVTLDDAQADAVRRFAYVKAVHEDGEVQAFAEDTTRITRIRADRVWNELKSRGEGIRVAVIDTGIDYNHPALAARYLAGGIDFVDGDDDPMDEHGHGTHVAGIVAGDSADVQGVAPAARVMAYRVLDEYGRGSDSTVIAGIERAVDPNGDGDLSDRVDIINLSLGGYGDADDPVSQSVDRAVMAGVVVFAAAGNTPGGQTIGSPAAARLAITVGNSDRDDVMHPTSSSGPSFPDFSMKPEIAAPGEAIRSAKRGGGTLVASGTSMASPHAAGVAALLLALHRDWTPADVKAALTASAKPLDTEVMRQGAGRIDAYGAATVPAAIAPAVLSIGRSPSKDAWTTTRTVRITNRAAEARTFTAKAVVPGGVQMTVE
ncbi:MAG TPA: S8 family serine peptidase, partial [Thermoanaerobaculia bacterium]|nr:S8 family serine peptidase [Thermoanaerobaculia bacterium]